LDAPQLVVVYPWNSVPGAGAGTLSPSTPGPVSGPAGAPLRLPGGERRRPPHLRLHLHKHYHSSPIKTTGILLTYSTHSSPIPLSNRTATAPGTPGASMAPAPCGTGNTRGKKDPGPCLPTCPCITSRTGAQGSREYNTYPGPKPPNDGQSAMGPYGSGTASHAKGTTHTTPQVHSPGRRRKALCQAQALAGKEPSDHAQS